MISLALLTICEPLFLPELVSSVWHIFHGNAATFHELFIPVPRGWWAFERNGSLIIQKMQRDVRKDQVVILDPMVIDRNYVFEDQKWKHAIIETKIADGYQFVREYKITFDKQEGFCLSFMEIKDSNQLWITCDVPERHVSVGFVGDKAWASSFESIVQHVTTKHPAQLN